MRIVEKMTPGLLRALSRQRSRQICVECGFPVPIYVGAYPKGCPFCECRLPQQSSAPRREKDVLKS